ncbi:helix-turn-helix domain-containing protein [Rhodovibrionaceae bacterium A322]
MSDSERSTAEQVFDVRPETTGEMLARVRETQGRNLRGVANDLRIRFVYLQALEEGRYADLPGQTYAVGFLRTYSEYLGLDSVKVVEHYKEEISGLPGGGNLVFPVPEPEGKIPGGLVVVISLLLLALAYGGWYVVTSQGDDLLALWDNLSQEDSSQEADTDTSAAPESPTSEAAEADSAASSQDSTKEAVPAPADSDTSQATETADSSAQKPPTAEAENEEVPAPTPQADIVTPTQEAPAPAQSPAPAVEETANATASAESETASDTAGDPSASGTQGNLNVVVTPAAEVEAQEAAAALASQVQDDSSAIPPAPNNATLGERTPRTYGEVNENARILLQANNDSWVQVRNQQDDVIFTQVLHKGDVYRVPDIEGLTLLTGNAGGLQILVDGKSVPTLGPVGEVRRNVSLSPDALLAGNNGTN